MGVRCRYILVGAVTEDEYKECLPEVLGPAPSDMACQKVQSYVSSLWAQHPNEAKQLWWSFPGFLDARRRRSLYFSNPELFWADSNPFLLKALSLEHRVHSSVPLEVGEFKSFLRAICSAAKEQLMALLHSLVQISKLQPRTWEFLISAYADLDPYIAFPALLASLNMLRSAAYQMPPVVAAHFAQGVRSALSHLSPHCRSAAAFVACEAWCTSVTSVRSQLQLVALLPELICLLRKGPQIEVSQAFVTITQHMLFSTRHMSESKLSQPVDETSPLADSYLVVWTAVNGILEGSEHDPSIPIEASDLDVSSRLGLGLKMFIDVSRLFVATLLAPVLETTRKTLGAWEDITERLLPLKQMGGNVRPGLFTDFIDKVVGLLRSDDGQISTAVREGIASFPQVAKFLKFDIKPIVQDLVQHISANAMHADVTAKVLGHVLRFSTTGDEDMTYKYLSNVPGQAEALPNLLPMIAGGGLTQSFWVATYLMVSFLKHGGDVEGLGLTSEQEKTLLQSFLESMNIVYWGNPKEQYRNAMYETLWRRLAFLTSRCASGTVRHCVTSCGLGKIMHVASKRGPPAVVAYVEIVRSRVQDVLGPEGGGLDEDLEGIL
jgi:hypothetical protein